MSNFDFEAEFRQEFGVACQDTLRDTGYPPNEWMTAGFRPKQDSAWWLDNGPDMCRAYAKWYRANPDINIWITPDGTPAVELELEVKFGKHPVKMAVDQVLIAGTAGLVLDLKSGGHVPDDPSQLGIYATGIELAYGWRPKYGAYFMTRGIKNNKKEITGYVTQPIDLEAPQFSYQWYTRQLDQLDQAEEAGVYLPRLNPMCRMCGVNRACTAYGGEMAYSLDPDYPH